MNMQVDECPYTADIGEVMSNFDGEIDLEVAEQLKQQEGWARYSAWNFHGRVWYDRDKAEYVCAIRQYRQLIATLRGTLQEIMDRASERYGNQ